MQITDGIWRDFLQRLRFGRVEGRDVAMLRSLILERSPIDDLSDPWKDVALITPRYAVREEWNCEAIPGPYERKRIYVCHARDTIRGRELSLEEKFALASRREPKGKRRRKELPEVVEIAVGVQNLETDSDIANGAHGEIVDVVLDEREEAQEDDAGTVHLKYPPLYVLVKLTHSRADCLDGLEERVIPLQAVTQKMRTIVDEGRGKHKIQTVTRQQYPVTAAYAFTDYQSQDKQFVASLSTWQNLVPGRSACSTCMSRFQGVLAERRFGCFERWMNRRYWGHIVLSSWRRTINWRGRKS